jgi:hypothetical protein
VEKVGRHESMQAPATFSVFSSFAGHWPSFVILSFFSQHVFCAEFLSLPQNPSTCSHGLVFWTQSVEKVGNHEATHFLEHCRAS